MEGAENPWLYIFIGSPLAAIGFGFAGEVGLDDLFGVVALAAAFVGLAMAGIGVISAGVSGGLQRHEWLKRRQAHRQANSLGPADSDE